MDISERRYAEEQYRTLFETMAQGVVYQDATGRITSVNPAAQRMLVGVLDVLLKLLSPFTPAPFAIVA